MSYKFTFFLVFFSIITKIFAIHLTSFDLFGDEAQYWIWSQTPNLGYYSKPPFLPWLLNVYTLVFGNSFETLKYFPLILYFFTSYVVFLLVDELYQDKDLAKISGLSFYLLPSVSFSSFLISTDVVLILFCSLSLLMILKIRRSPNIYNFVILGIFLGISFLTKYAVIYYLLSIVLILFLDKKIQKSFILHPLNSFVFFVCFSIIISPNLLWNIQNEWVTLSHTSDNVGLKRIDINFFRGLGFISSQAIMLGPLLFLFFIFIIKKLKLSFQTKFLLVFSLPVFCIVLIESILVRANANWAAAGLIPFFVLMIYTVKQKAKKIILYNNILNFCFCFLLFFLISTSSNLGVFDRISGVSTFSYELEKTYLTKTNFLVVEDRLLYSSLTYHLKEVNKNLLTPYNPEKNIKSHFHLTHPLKPQHNKNFVYIGNPESLNYLQNKFKIINKKTIKARFKQRPIEIYEVVF